MRLARLAALLAVSCAPSAPTEYQRNPLPRPAAAPTRPGVGLPLPQMWVDPGHPRGRNERILPETEETRKAPGIWATTPEPPAALGVMGMRVPLPRNATPTEVGEVAGCAKRMDDAAKARLDVAAISITLRPCLALYLQHDCLTQRWNDRKSDSQYKGRPVTESTFAALKRAIDVTANGIAIVCGGQVNVNLVNSYRATIWQHMGWPFGGVR